MSDPTPPDTPGPGKRTGPGPANVGGDVDFKGANIKNSIATGHIHGYEVILTTINVTIDTANKLTKNIQEFVAEVDLQLHLLSRKVDATTSILDDINDLVVKQAKKKGLTVDKGVKLQNEIRNEYAYRGNVVGSSEETRQMAATREILSMTCFRAIIKRTEGAREAFNNINEKIKKALKVISLSQKLHEDGQEAVTGISVRGPGPDAQSTQRHPGTPKGKVGLSNEDRKEIHLTEKDLVWMEKEIEIHWNDLYYRFIIFEYSLKHERQDKNEEDIESIKQELERVKLVGRNTWKEIKRLAKYLCDNDQPPSPLDGFGWLRTGSPPKALRRNLPKPSRVNSLYVGWEFRKSLPLPPPHQYGRLDQPAQKPSWSFAVPQRMPFSTEELFLRVLAQTAQRAKSDRTLRDEYWGALKKAGQRALVDQLVQAQNYHLQRDFPELEWTIAGLETKTDPWALIAVQGRSRAREKKRKTVTAFEVILKTQWQIARGYGPPMPIPGGISGPTPVGPSGLGLRLSPLPGGKNGAPPDGYRAQAPRGPVGGPSIPSGGSAGGGQGVPITITADAGIPAHSQPRPRESTRSKQKPMMVLREPNRILVKEGGKKQRKSEDKNKNSRRQDAGSHRNREKTSKTKYYVELRELGRYYRTASGGPCGGGQRPSSPLGPENSHRPPLVPPLRTPPLPRPSSDFVPADRGHWRAHISPVLPVARSPPPQPTHIHVSSMRKQSEEEEEEEAEGVVEKILEEFSELTDTKRKMNNRRSPMQVPEHLSPNATSPVAGEGLYREREHRQHQWKHADSHASISMSLMEEVERKSSRRMTAEGDDLHKWSKTLERMSQIQTSHPPAFVVPGPVERTRLARERESRASRRRSM
ncbi:hypothetical protein diail_5931 [Diaporthe ilicicola]|nr:hypothetical protein diail_5931 [Diaporthe ilicicola]